MRPMSRLGGFWRRKPSWRVIINFLMAHHYSVRVKTEPRTLLMIRSRYRKTSERLSAARASSTSVMNKSPVKETSIHRESQHHGRKSSLSATAPRWKASLPVLKYSSRRRRITSNRICTPMVPRQYVKSSLSADISVPSIDEHCRIANKDEIIIDFICHFRWHSYHFDIFCSRVFYRSYKKSSEYLFQIAGYHSIWLISTSCERTLRK